MTILLGMLRVIGLKGLSWLFGAWLNPVMRVGLGIAAVSLVAIAVMLFWPSDNAVERAIMDALRQRETITQDNTDEETRDNAWLEEYQRWMQAEREAAAKAPGATADRVIWRADDPWLRNKRAAKAR